MSADHYVIRGGLAGRERLRVLARVTWPTTSALLERVGVHPAARCLDMGCGGGDVTVALARLAPDGFVVGADMDELQLDVARREAAEAGLANIDYRVLDVMQPPSDDEQFDLIYVRFLLTHLPDPSLALTHVCARLARGGALVVEDIDFTGSFCHPDNAAFWRYVQLYTDAVTGRGGDPNIGIRLPSLLRATGLTDPQMNVVQAAGFDGEVKMIAPITRGDCRCRSGRGTVHGGRAESDGRQPIHLRRRRRQCPEHPARHAGLGPKAIVPQSDSLSPHVPDRSHTSQGSSSLG